MSSHYQPEDYSNFRTTFFLETVIPVLLLPLICGFVSTHLLANQLGLQLSRPLQAAIIILSIPAYGFIVVTWRDFCQRQEAKRLGARLIPRVRSKWPGNCNFIFGASKSRKTYLAEPIREIMQKYNSTTVNLRLLWTDHVCHWA